MDKTEPQAQFDYLVSQLLWPAFKQRGYRKSGNNFRYYQPTGWGKILNLQKSTFGDRHNISFTVNIGLYLPEAEHLWSGRTSDEKFLEPDCVIRKRVGQLSGTKDLWYELTEPVDPAVVVQVQQDITAYVLPYLDEVVTREDVLQQLILQRGPDSALAIKTLFACGHQEAARQWLDHELATTIYRKHRQQMLEV